jgi:hypothetical protein
MSTELYRANVTEAEAHPDDYPKDRSKLVSKRQ